MGSASSKQQEQKDGSKNKAKSQDNNNLPSKQKQKQKQQLKEEKEAVKQQLILKLEPEEDWPWIWAIRDASEFDWKYGLSDEEIQEYSKKQQDLPVKIHENLYLGNCVCVQDIQKLQDLGITKVLNMAGPFALKSNLVRAFKREGISYKQIHALDEMDYPLLEKHWYESYDFIHNQQQNNQNNTNNNEKCVIHCVAGMNRSVLIVAACYMMDQQIPILEALRHIRRQRGNVALQNEGFQEQLVAFARRHNLLGAKPGTPESAVKEIPPQFNEDDLRKKTKPETNEALARLAEK